jgi:hypothetical protein
MEFEQYYLNSTPAHWNIESLSAIAEAMPDNGPLFIKEGEEVSNGAEYLTLLRQELPFVSRDTALLRTFAVASVYLSDSLDDIKHERYKNEALKGLEDRYEIARLSEILWYTALNYEKDIFPVVLVSAGQLHLNALYCYAVNLPYLYGSVIFNHMEVVAEYLIQKSAELELSDQFSPRIAYLMASANEFNSKTQEKNYWLKRADDFSRGNAFMRLNSTFINCGMKIEEFFYKISSSIFFKDKDLVDINLLNILLQLNETNANINIRRAIGADKNLIPLAQLEYELRLKFLSLYF